MAGSPSRTCSKLTPSLPFLASFSPQAPAAAEEEEDDEEEDDDEEMEDDDDEEDEEEDVRPTCFPSSEALTFPSLLVTDLLLSSRPPLFLNLFPSPLPRSPPNLGRNQLPPVL